MSKLDYITVRGFKSLASIEELKPGPLTVLIGPNGSGKTNFLGVFSFLNAIRHGRLRTYVAKAGGADKVLHFGSRVTEMLHIGIAFRNEPPHRHEKTEYEITLEPSAADKLVPASEFVRFHDERSHGRPYEDEIHATSMWEAGISMPDLRGTALSVKRRLAGLRLHHFHDTSATSPLKKTAQVNDNHHLRHDGSNLAAFLHLLREKHGHAYRTIVGTVRQVAPFFQDFVLEPELEKPDTILLRWEHRERTRTSTRLPFRTVLCASWR